MLKPTVSLFLFSHNMLTVFLRRLLLVSFQLISEFKQSGDERICWEFIYTTRWNYEQFLADRTRHRSLALVLFDVLPQTLSTERVDGARKDPWIGEDVAADGTFDELTVEHFACQSRELVILK